MKTKILFVACNKVKDYYGITSGLFNSATFVVNFLNEVGYDAKLVSVDDSNSIDKVVTEFNPSIVVIEALWVSPTKFKELLKFQRHAARRWIVRVHSKAPFLANEGLAIGWIQQYTLIENGKIEIAPNTLDLFTQFQSALPWGKFVFLPNVYQPPKYENLSKPVYSNFHINIGCFGAVRPMKNTFQQALAAIDFAQQEGKKLRFHINSSRIEQSGENVMKNLRALFEFSEHDLIEHPWYKHREFVKVASEMDLGMQVSFSESFNIVTADFVTAGVPIVVSDDIEWMPWLLKVSPTNHEEIVRRMRIAYGFKNLCKYLQKRALKNYNHIAKAEWLKILSE